MKRNYGWKKRLLAFALSAAVGLGAVPFSGISTQEVYAAEMKGISQDHWAWESMKKMYDQGILSGDAAGNMHPDRAVTRAEFISMLNRAFNYTQYDNGAELPFEDMNGEEWYASHIRAAYAQGYFSGVSEKEAGATQQITREAAAAMLCRNTKVENDTLQLTQFTDGTQISQWSRGAVGAAVDKGYLKGYADGTFRPKNYISRAEAATMLANALGSILSEGGTYSGVYEGNVTLSTSNVTLQDVVISGDLYITEGVGTGYVNLENVTVLGEVIVCGGGEAQWGGNSVQMKHCNIQKLTVDGADDRAVSLYALGDTTIAETNIKSTTYLQNHADTVPGFDNIKVFGPEDTTLYLSGNFKMVDLINPQNKVVLGKGEVEQLTVDEEAKEGEVQLDRGTVVKTLNVDGQADVTGKGDIQKLVITANDTTVEQFPDQIEIRPGVITEIAGEEMSSADAEESSEAPRILAGYPKANEISSTSAKVQISGNKTGTIYWAVTYGDVDELTQEEILKPSTVARIQKSGTLSVAESAKELEVALSSLESDAEFTISAILVDSKENVSRIKDATFRTKDATKPGFVNGYPTTKPIDSHRFDIEAMPLKDGTIYWAVFAKGAAQPTAYQMRSQELKGAIVYGKHTDCERNVEYILKAEHETLVEDVSYDVYVMVSDGDQDSAIVKLVGVTKDTTPPEYLDGTPIQIKNTANSVTVNMGANEEATAYYVIIEWDDEFPIPVLKDNVMTQPKLDWEEAKQQVMAGSNAKLSGKASLKADTVTPVTINGLEEETPYKLFVVLEDKSGNLSEVVKMLEIKTKDETPPKAYVTCDDPIDGKMPVEEPIKIVFNEIVLNSYKEGTELSKDNLSRENIKLYDVTLNKEEEVTIDFSKVTTENGEKGATILVFPPSAFNDGKGLSSGSKYQFELNYMIDTSSNAIKKDTRLEIFETVPPLVVLAETVLPDTPELDYTFSLTPESKKTSDLVLFDMLLKADQDIGIEIYRKGSTGQFQKITQKNSTLTQFAMDANTLTSLCKLTDEEFGKFNQLEDTEYGIKVVRIGSDTVRDGWNATVKLEVICVAGQKRDLQEVINGTANVGDAVTNVNYSMQNPQNEKEFILKMPFSDKVVPYFIDEYPIIKNDGIKDSADYIVMDTMIRPKLMTDRKATMYYVIAKTGTLSDDYFTKDASGNHIGITTDKTKQEELAQRLRAQTLTPDGSFYGVYQITQGKSEMQPTFPTKGDLAADTDYEMLMVLKGVPEQLSDVYYRSFKTLETKPPVITNILTLPASETSVPLQIITDKRAEVHWMVLPVDQVASFEGKNDDEQIEFIRNGQEVDGITPKAHGSGTTSPNSGAYSMTVSISNIERPNQYVLYAVAKQLLSSGEVVGKDSAVAKSSPFTSKDVTPPKIDSITTSATANNDGTYNGEFTMIFTEGMYYLESLGSGAQPVTEEKLKSILSEMSGSGRTFTATTITTVPVTNDKGDTATAMKSCVIDFKNVKDGATVMFGAQDFCDANGNLLGTIVLTFHVNAGTLVPEWEYRVIEPQ